MLTKNGKLDEGAAFVKVQLKNDIEVEFLIDTGFTGSLCVPKKYLEDLGLKIVSQAPVFGVGIYQDIYDVAFTEVFWFEEWIPDVAVYLNEGDDFLLGTSLLENKELYINYKTGEVVINRI